MVNTTKYLLLCMSVAILSTLASKAALAQNFEHANELFYSDKKDEAIAEYKACLAAKGTPVKVVPLIHGKLGRAYLAKHKPDLALDQFNLALKTANLKDATLMRLLYSSRATAYQDMGKADRAIAELRKAIELPQLNRSKSELYDQLADQHVSLHQYKEAVDDLTVSVKLLDEGMHTTKTDTAGPLLRLKTSLSKVMYKRASVYRLWGKPKEAQQDRSQADHLVEDL